MSEQELTPVEQLQVLLGEAGLTPTLYGVPVRLPELQDAIERGLTGEACKREGPSSSMPTGAPQTRGLKR